MELLAPHECRQPEEVRFKFYLIAGFRDAEGRFVTRRNLDVKQTAVPVTAKPHWGFHPKNWEESEVPVPRKLISMLQEFRPEKASPDDPLFPSCNGHPDGAMLEKLKAVAFRSKLNWGHCVTPHKLEDGKLKINRCSKGTLLWALVSTNFGTPLPRATSRMESTSARCGSGWGIVI